MISIEQVLACAKQLEDAGKTPTTALLKTKLKQCPLPILIQGLQQFKTMSDEQKQHIQFSPPTTTSLNNTSDKEAALSQQVAELQQAYQLLNTRLAQLEQQVEQLQQQDRGVRDSCS